LLRLSFFFQAVVVGIGVAIAVGSGVAIADQSTVATVANNAFCPQHPNASSGTPTSKVTISVQPGTEMENTECWGAEFKIVSNYFYPDDCVDEGFPRMMLKSATLVESKKLDDTRDALITTWTHIFRAIRRLQKKHSLVVIFLFRLPSMIGSTRVFPYSRE
jgi:hypothetical protein